MAKAEWYEEKEGRAEHLVYLNKEGKELEKMLKGEKAMIIRGAAGKKSPLGGRAKVDESEKMTVEESIEFIKQFEEKLNLSKKQFERWAGKKYLAVYEISKLEEIEPFKYNREKNMDDWIITDDINKIKL